MRRLALGLLLASLVAAGVALAQDIVPIKIAAHVTVSPNKAGTPAHPQGVKIDVRATVDIPHDYEPPLVNTVDVWVSRGGRYNGGKFPTCSAATMAHGGIAACPKGSIMGHGKAVAEADTVPTYPTITVVNGGAHAMFFYTVLTHPARVAEPVPATITKLSGGPWAYKLHSTIPRSIQIVAGIPLRLNSLHVFAGRRDWLATTSCPSDHRWRYHVEAHYNSGQVVRYDGSVRCRS